MSGERLLLDTNAVVSLLRGEGTLASDLESAAWIGISVITQIEFLAFGGLGLSEEVAFGEFCGRVYKIGLDAENKQFLDSIIRVRKSYGLKLPDAVIAATAIEHKATLLTRDSVFTRVKELSCAGF